MKYKSKQLENIYNHRSLFKASCKLNHYDVNLAESEEHDKAVLEQFFYLRRRNHCVAVRQPLLTGEVPDLAILDLPRIMIKEICVSETKSRLKSKTYPGNIIEVRK